MFGCHNKFVCTYNCCWLLLKHWVIFISAPDHQSRSVLYWRTSDKSPRSWVSCCYCPSAIYESVFWISPLSGSCIRWLLIGRDRRRTTLTENGYLLAAWNFHGYWNSKDKISTLTQDENTELTLLCPWMFLISKSITCEKFSISTKIDFPFEVFGVLIGVERWRCCVCRREMCGWFGIDCWLIALEREGLIDENALCVLAF